MKASGRVVSGQWKPNREKRGLGELDFENSVGAPRTNNDMKTKNSV